jgi:multidrug efflux system membrane fusion protein
MQRIPWKKLVLALGIVVLLAVTVQAVRHRDSARAEAPTAVPVPVHVAVAMRGDVELTLQVTGHAEAYATVSVRSRVDGQLESLDFTPGAAVRKGEIIARIDPRLLRAHLDQSLGNLARDQAQLTKAQADLKRYAEMIDKGYVSKADYDTYKANAATYQAAIKSDQAAVELARTQLDYADIRAPFDGIAGAPLVYPGAIVSADDTDLVVINQVSPIRVAFPVPESSLAAIRRIDAHGPLDVQVRVPGAGDAPLKGTLEFIDNSVATNTGTIVLKARLPNVDHRLTPGQFVNVTLPTARLVDAVSVPAVALQHAAGGAFVYVVDKDGVAHQRSVEPGAGIDQRLVIDKGLQAGERVVTDGQMLLVDGARVRVLTADG